VARTVDLAAVAIELPIKLSPLARRQRAAVRLSLHSLLCSYGSVVRAKMCSFALGELIVPRAGLNAIVLILEPLIDALVLIVVRRSRRLCRRDRGTESERHDDDRRVLQHGVLSSAT
jgi:hypothetical protein